MSQTRSHTSGPSLTPIERLRCPKCQTRMSLARIVPGPKGFDHCNFECGSCNHVATKTVCIDPMASGSANCVNADFSPP
jgi:hypothetical protein